MAVSIVDDVRLLLTEYDLQLDPERAAEWRRCKCVLCERLAVDAFQTYCECTYCCQCVTDYLNAGSLSCGGGKDNCSEENLVMDQNVSRSPPINRAITRAPVCCPHPLCVVITVVASMRVHIEETCPERPLICPYNELGCTLGGVSAAQVEAHLRDEVWGHARMVVAAIGTLRSRTGGGAGDNAQGELGTGETRLADLEEQVAQLRADVAVLVSEHSNIRNEAETQRRGVAVGARGPVAGDADAGREGALEVAVAAIRSEVDTLSQGYLSMRAETSTLLRESMSIIREDPFQMDLVNAVADTSAIVSQSRDTALSLERRLVQSFQNTVSFSIDNVQARLASATVIHSPHFYSHTNGYKLRLQICPRYKDRDATYMSVFVLICNGEFNDLLPWPFKHTLAISITNQDLGQAHKTETYNSLSYRGNIRKPALRENVVCGLATFISHKELESVNGLIVNDTVILPCTISAPSE